MLLRERRLTTLHRHWSSGDCCFALLLSCSLKSYAKVTFDRRDSRIDPSLPDTHLYIA